MRDPVQEEHVSIAQIVESVVDGPLPLRLEAYDGSAAGPADARYRLRIENERGVSYLATAPGDLGMARAYVTGDLTVEGAHPGDPYELLATMAGDPLPAPAQGAGPRARPHPGRQGPHPAAPAAAGDAAALAPGGRGAAALDDARRRGDPPPLRRLEPLLRDGPRAVDDVHVRVLPHGGGHPRGGPGEQVPARLRQARPAARATACSTSAAAGAAWSATPPDAG